MLSTVSTKCQFYQTKYDFYKYHMKNVIPAEFCQVKLDITVGSSVLSMIEHFMNYENFVNNFWNLLGEQGWLVKCKWLGSSKTWKGNIMRIHTKFILSSMHFLLGVYFQNRRLAYIVSPQIFPIFSRYLSVGFAITLRMIKHDKYFNHMQK